MALNIAQIQKAKPSEKARKLSDERGLYLEISPGGGKWWRLKYRFEGREKRLSLGVYPEVSLKEARVRRDEARSLLAAGVDPGENRKAQKSAKTDLGANSFEVVTLEWLGKYSPRWAEKHTEKVRRLFERDIFPWLGQRPIAEITPPELLKVLRRIEERGAVDTAHRALGSCGQVFRYGIATSRCERDAAADIRGALERVDGGHFSATTDPKRLAAILRTLDAYEGSLIVRCALRLAPLVFVRPGELRTAKWAEIDFEKSQWEYFVTKTKTQHIVPLSRQATDILRDLQRLTGRGLFIFPSARSDKRPMSDNAINAAMRRLEIGK